MIKFPLTELLDEPACYEWSLKILHPKGLPCPSRRAIPAGQAPHDRQRAPIVKYKCRECGKVFHIFTGTDLSGRHYTCGRIVLILRGFLQDETTQHIAEELGLDYGTLLSWRHRIQRQGFAHLINGNLPDEEAEMDKMFQNAGEKGAKKRSNSRPTKTTWESTQRQGNHGKGPLVEEDLIAREMQEHGYQDNFEKAIALFTELNAPKQVERVRKLMS